MPLSTRLARLRELLKPRGSMDGLRFLFSYLKPYRGRFAIALIALLLSSLSGLAFPGLTGGLVDAVSKPGGGRFGSLNTLTLLLIGVLVAQSVFSYIRTYYLMDVTERSVARLRRDLYEKILTLPMGFFHRNRVGDLSSRLSADLGTIQVTLTNTLSELIRQSVIMIGGIALVAYTSPQLTSVILIAIPILVLLAVIFGRAIRSSSKKVQDLYARLNTVVEETFQGITVVKAFTAEAREGERYGSELTTLVGIALKVARARGAFVAFIVFVLFGGIVGVIWYGGRMVQNGTLTIGDLTSFVLYALFVGGAMGSFADLYSGLQRALGASERIREIMAETSEELDPSVPAPKVEGHLRLAGIGFAYPSRSDVAVLSDVSLDIPAGSSLAIVGPSGAGKSTLAGLIMRFHEPSSGRMTIDGIDTSEIPLSAYRSLIALVPQDIVLFGGTIAENIGYGRPGATDQEIRDAARLANALDFIESFPEGFATVVGERGVQLSGGQRQRVALARAIIKDPTILLLDEATSSLDSESERLVQEALERVMRGRTTIIIAHRLSTIRNADRIAVVRNGVIAELGGYDELIAAGGLFARLASAQSRAGEDIIDERMMAE